VPMSLWLVENNQRIVYRKITGIINKINVAIIDILFRGDICDVWKCIKDILFDNKILNAILR
jgi:hypothetical protein